MLLAIALISQTNLFCHQFRIDNLLWRLVHSNFRCNSFNILACICSQLLKSLATTSIGTKAHNKHSKINPWRKVTFQCLKHSSVKTLKCTMPDSQVPSLLRMGAVFPVLSSAEMRSFISKSRTLLKPSSWTLLQSSCTNSLSLVQQLTLTSSVCQTAQLHT